MPQRLKELMARELTSRYAGTKNCIIVDYQGLTAEEARILRQELRANNMRLEVLRNRIAARAFDEIGLGEVKPFLVGTSAIVTGDADTVAMSKLITGWVKEHEKLSVLGGLMDGDPVQAATVEQLATIPPMEVLYEMLLGSINSPLVSVAGAFQSLLRHLACALDEIRKKKPFDSAQGPERFDVAHRPEPVEGPVEGESGVRSQE